MAAILRQLHLEEEQPRQPLVGPSGVWVTDAPKFDLESYISNYDHPTRLDRLIHIGVSSRTLSREALAAAVSEVKKGGNVDRYVALAEHIHGAYPADPNGTVDTAWADAQRQHVQSESNRLEQELKGYKNNLIKESIRMGNEDLGNHYLAIGNLPAAYKAYSRMRDQCTTQKHIVDMSLRLALTGTAQENWMTVQSNMYKIQQLQLKKEERGKVDPLLSPIIGLANMCSGNYEQAARSFLASSPDYMSMGPVAGNPAINFQRQVMSPNDVAVYGSLTALAVLPREQLQAQVLDNASFRNFLELEPHLRRAIAAFVLSKYTTCLEILESYRNDYLLDIHLHKHIPELYSRVRRRSMVAYVKPFSRISMHRLASTFAVENPSDMMDELIGLIEDGQLPNMRVDAVGGVLEAVEKDDRREAHEQALNVAREAEKSLRLRLHRINCLQANFEVGRSNPQSKGTKSGA